MRDVRGGREGSRDATMGSWMGRRGREEWRKWRV